MKSLKKRDMSFSKFSSFIKFKCGCLRVLRASINVVVYTEGMNEGYRGFRCNFVKWKMAQQQIMSFFSVVFLFGVVSNCSKCIQPTVLKVILRILILTLWIWLVLVWKVLLVCMKSSNANNRNYCIREINKAFGNCKLLVWEIWMGAQFCPAPKKPTTTHRRDKVKEHASFQHCSNWIVYKFLCATKNSMFCKLHFDIKLQKLSYKA